MAYVIKMCTGDDLIQADITTFTGFTALPYAPLFDQQANTSRPKMLEMIIYLKISDFAAPSGSIKKDTVADTNARC